MRRNCTVELIVDEEMEKRLRRLCDLSSKLWNEVNIRQAEDVAREEVYRLRGDV
jgi:hypothetical protein